MTDAAGSLLDLLVTAALWRVVSELLRDQPGPVLAVVGIGAALLYLARRRNSDRPLTRGPRR